MKKIIPLLLSLTLLFSLCSCGSGYVSSYSALGLTKSNTSHSCKASFASLNGQLVFNASKTTAGEGDIKYSVSAEKGEITVYYDIYGTKEKLVAVSEGETKENSGGYIESGKRVYIIIEAKDAKGSLSIELNG